MAGFTIKIENLEAVTKLAERYPAAAEKYIDQAIRGTFLRVLSFVKQPEGAPVGVNNFLRDQWKQTFIRFGGTLEAVAPYASAVEFGTLPHFVSGSNPQLQKWAAKKGLNPYAVANSIKKKGTRANPFFDRSIMQANDGANQEFKKCLDNIAQEIAK